MFALLWTLRRSWITGRFVARETLREPARDDPGGIYGFGTNARQVIEAADQAAQTTSRNALNLPAWSRAA
jgi:hypothetical protein